MWKCPTESKLVQVVTLRLFQGKRWRGVFVVNVTVDKFKNTLDTENKPADCDVTDVILYSRSSMQLLWGTKAI